jgi:hypothetical protein
MTTPNVGRDLLAVETGVYAITGFWKRGEHIV